MQRFLLSILIPVYNVEKYLSRCIDSIIPQLNDDCEVLLVDDGSTDESGAICDKYAKRIENFTVIHKKNEGAYPTRNIALDNARGAFVWFIDPDDFLEPNIISKITSIINSHNPDILSMEYRRYNGNNYSNYENHFEYYGIESGEQYLLNRRFNPYLWNKIFNKNFLLDNQLRFDDRLHTQGDWPFCMFAAISAKKIFISNIYAYNYFIANETSTLHVPTVKAKKIAAINSIIVQTDFHKNIESMQHTNFYKVLKEQEALSISGFFYSLYRFGYSHKTINKIIKRYKKQGLYPIPPTNNKKADLFRLFANCKPIFIISCKLKNAITRKGFDDFDINHSSKSTII